MNANQLYLDLKDMDFGELMQPSASLNKLQQQNVQAGNSKQTSQELQPQQQQLQQQQQQQQLRQQQQQQQLRQQRQQLRQQQQQISAGSQVGITYFDFSVHELV